MEQQNIGTGAQQQNQGAAAQQPFNPNMQQPGQTNGYATPNAAYGMPQGYAPTQQPYPYGVQPQIVVNVSNDSINSNVNKNTNAAGEFGAAISTKSKVVALLLCIFLGVFGIHRFYVGKVGTGILYLFTFGIFGIGVIIDLIMIIVGSFRDKYGLPVVR